MSDYKATAAAETMLEEHELELEEVAEALGLDPSKKLGVAPLKKYIAGLGIVKPADIEPEPEPEPPPVDPEILAAVDIVWECSNAPERVAEGVAAELARHGITEATVTAWHRNTPTECGFLTKGRKPMTAILRAPDEPPSGPAANFFKGSEVEP